MYTQPNEKLLSGSISIAEIGFTEPFKIISNNNNFKYNLIAESGKIKCDVQKNFMLVTSNLNIYKNFTLEFLDESFYDLRKSLEFPYNQVIFIQSKINKNSFGSGTLIGKNKILTAAHVVKKFEKEGMTLHSGYDYNNQTQDLIFVKANYHPDYDGFNHDLAVITVENKSENYFLIQQSENFTNIECVWIGYPADLIYNNNSIQQYIDVGEVSTFEKEQAKCPHVSFGGQSGSGLLNINDNYNNNVLGVLSSQKSIYIKFEILAGSNYNFVYSCLT